MASSTKSKNTWIRSFTVTDPTKHERGFTVYKVTYRAFSLAKPDDIIETVVWKRYNDFKKLHKALAQLHYNLRRPEKFPVFAKAKFFGRFDDDVIEERRQSALKLLEFVAKISPLTRSKFFLTFFQGGEEVSVNQFPPAPLLQPKILLPTPSNGTPRSTSPPTSDSASTTPVEGREQGSSEGLSSSPSLGGVWLHRQNEEDISEYGTVDYDDDDDDDRTTFSEDSVPSTPLPQLQDMSFFDPLSDTEPSSALAELSPIPQSNSWLFQAMDMCAVLNEDPSQDSPTNATPADSTTDLSTDSGITINFTKGLDASTGVTSPQDQPQAGTTFLPDSTEDIKNERNTMARAYLNCIRAQQAAERDAMYTDGGMVDSRSLSTKPRMDETGSMGVAPDPVTVGGEEDYLYQAAYHISLALENEANGGYQAAFDLYKSGVGVLLKGVIADDNKNRREAVRRKTAQYLMKAEDLYNKYLSADATNTRRWESEQPSIDVDPRSAHLRGPQEELKNYKVLGLIDSVLLVLDTVTYQTFVIKVLLKSSTATKRATCAPANCRYMVKPYRLIETDNAIFLVLEHASGGKLWSYVSGFLNHGTESSYNQVLAGSLERKSIGSCGSRRSRHSTASGKEDRKLKEDVYKDNVFPEPSPAAERFGDFVSSTPEDDGVNAFSSDASPSGANSYANLVIDYGKTCLDPAVQDGFEETAMPPAVTDDFSREFDDLDIQDTETNLNDLANQYSQYENLSEQNHVDNVLLSVTEPGRLKIEHGLDRGTTAPMNLFSIDSLESPGSELHSAGSADKPVFGFGTPVSLPKDKPEDAERVGTDGHLDGKTDVADASSHAMLSTWVDHNPEDVIADALKVMEDLEDDSQNNLVSGTACSSSHKPAPSEFEDFNALPPNISQVCTLPDTSGFASAMTDEVISSKPGTDLAEFFDTGFKEDMGTLPESKTRPPLVRHSVSMFERGIHDDSSPRHRQHSNPLDFRVVRSSSFEEGGSKDILSSLMQVKDEDRGGFGSVSPWAAQGRAVGTTKSELNLGEMLGGALSNTTVSQDDGKVPATQSEITPSQPNLDLSLARPSDPFTTTQSSTNPTNLSPMSTLEGSEAIVYSSCESTPKHSIYSPDYDSGTVMDSPNMESPDPHSAHEQDLESTHKHSNLSDTKSTLGDSEATPTHQLTVPHLEAAAPATASPKPKPRDAHLPSITTLFAQIDEQVTVTKSSTLPESCVRLWAAEILLALTDLHAAGITCQDLRPDNILLAEGGHIRLTYFSQWQYVEKTLNAYAREHFYTAPEVNGIFSVTPACDWWSFGVLLYELLTGMSLHSCHPSGLSSHTQLILPDHVSPEAASLLKQLLQVNPSERLGSQRAGGAEEIRIHQFFKEINWTNLQKTAHS